MQPKAISDTRAVLLIRLLSYPKSRSGNDSALLRIPRSPLLTANGKETAEQRTIKDARKAHLEQMQCGGIAWKSTAELRTS
jgi:hypothetical protein